MVGTVVAPENMGTNEQHASIDMDVPMLIPFGPVPVHGCEAEPVKPVPNVINIFSINPAEQVDFWKF